ncbi:hypothetical protein ACIBL8_41380 [Streptomyces sp. NPDC050523]|uniref:hypothetical protein n=1 Tax=Streptomyces sp. NPDC050523 TaxID=3365622 RepID=UPI0037B929A2
MRECPRTDLILALADGLTAEDVNVVRPFLRLAELARPDAPDAELLADALVSLDAVWSLADTLEPHDEETGR